MMPDLSTLSDFVRVVHQWGLTGAPPENLLNATLPMFMQAMPEVQALHLHTVSRNKLLLFAATDLYISGDSDPTNANEQQLQTITDHKPIKYDDNTGWAIGLGRGRQTPYLLEVITDDQAPSTENAQEWLESFTLQLSNELNHYEIKGLLHRQSLVFNHLVAGLSFEDMAVLIARYMLVQPGRAFSFVEVLYEDDAISGWRIIATANRNGALDLPDTVVTWDEIGNMTMTMLDDFAPVLIPDVEAMNSDDLAEWLIELLKSQGVNSYLSIPIVIDGLISYTLTVTSFEKYAFSPEEVDIFQSVAALIGSLNRIHHLASETDVSNSVIENLVLGNRLITTATNTAYMAQAVIYTLTQEITASLITRFDRIIPPGEQPIGHVVEAMGTSVNVYEFEDAPTRYMFNEDEINRLRAGLPIIVNDASIIQNALPTELVESLAEYDIHWASVFGLRSGEQLLGSLVLLHSSARSLSEAEISAYTTLADQIGVMMHSRQLLYAAQQAHERALQLVNTNRAISTSQDYDDMSEVFLNAMPPEVGAVAIALPTEVSTLGELGERIRVEVLRTRSAIVRPQDVDFVDTKHAGFQSFYNNMISGKTVHIPDTRTLDPVLKVLVKSLADEGFTNLVMSGLLSPTGVLGVVVLGIAEGVQLDQVWLASITSMSDQMATTIENRRLLQQTNEALGFVHAQFETTSTLYRASNPAHMLYAIHKLAVFSGGEFSYAHIATPDEPNSPEMTILAEYDGTALETISQPINIEDYVGAALLKEGRAVISLNFSDADTILSEEERDKLVEQDARSVMILPMVDTKQVLRGLVYMTASGLIEMSIDQQQALVSTVGQAAIVLENRDLFRRMENSLYEARVLHNLSRDLLNAGAMQDVQQVIFTHAALDSDAVMGLSVNYDNKKVTDIVVNDIVGLMGVETENVSLTSMIELDVLASYAESWGDERVVRFAEDVQDTALSIYLKQKYLKSVIEVPTFSEGHLSGIIIIGYQEPKTFDDSLQRLYGIIVDQVNIVLENQHLLQTTEVSLRETRMLYDVNRDLLTADDSLAIVHILYSHVVDKGGTLNLLRVNWDIVNNEIAEVIIEERAANDAVESLNSPLLMTLPADKHDDIKEQLRDDYDVVFVEDVAAVTEQRPLLHAVVGEETKSAVLLPIWDDDRVVYMIVVGLATARTFTITDRRLYHAIRDQVMVVLQNHRLLRDTQTAAANLGAQVRVLQTINHLAATLSVTRDEQSLMDVTAESLHQSLGVDHVGIVMADEDKTTLSLVSEYPDTGIVGATFSMDDPFQQKLSQLYDPFVIRSVRDSNEFIEETKQRMLDIGINSLAFFPLQDPNYGYIGSISLDLYSPDRSFNENMMNIARTITSQVTVTLQNIRLLEGTQRQARQMELVAGFSQAIQTTLDVPTLLEIGMGNAQAIIASDHMAIMLLDTQSGKLKTVAWHEGDERPQVNMMGGPEAKLQGTTAGMVWRTHSPLQFDDLFERDDMEYTFKSGMRSALSIPVYSRGAVTGIIELASEKSNFYSATDFAVFQQLVSQLSTAIENAEVYTQSQRLAQSKVQVNDISTHLQQNMDIERLLDVTMSELGKAIGAKRARIRLGLKDDGGNK